MTARCSPCCAARLKNFLDKREIWLALFALMAQTTISSSGCIMVRKRESLQSFSNNATAACLEPDKPEANAPFFTMGNSLWVAHKATALAPGRDNSRLISPRCNSAEVKYV